MKRRCLLNIILTAGFIFYAFSPVALSFDADGSELSAFTASDESFRGLTLVMAEICASTSDGKRPQKTHSVIIKKARAVVRSRSASRAIRLKSPQLFIAAVSYLPNYRHDAANEDSRVVCKSAYRFSISSGLSPPRISAS